MITKMTKYSFVLLSEQAEGFLAKLSELGLMDITRSAKPIDETSEKLIADASFVKRMVTRLSGVDYAGDPDAEAIMKAAAAMPASADPAADAQGAFASLTDLNTGLAAALKETGARKPWGDFDPDMLHKLSEAGYDLKFYRCAEKKFQEAWTSLYPVEVISRAAGEVWFVLVHRRGEPLDFPLQETAAPEGPWQLAMKTAEDIHDRIIQEKARLEALKRQIPEMESAYEDTLKDLDQYLAGAAAEKSSEGMVTVFQGFAPTENDETVCAALDQMDTFYLKEAATKEDNPPIRLKNNWFARLFETLTGMYGMPVYDEFDPTPILAPFFLLFWAFCMGDAGYGLLLIGISFLLKKVNILDLRGHRKLVLTLGIGTFIIGLFLGTFFGINLAEASWFPEPLKKLLITGKFPGTSYDMQMVAAIAIGVFHICLAMVIKAVGLTKRFGFKQAISTWGWVLLIIGSLVVAALALTSVLDASVTKWAVIVIGVLSALGIFVFNTPGRNPLLNIGAGLWDTYNMATGILGDVLSYIRLYALGLAGGMLGGAFNTLGTMMLGDHPTWQWLPCILILLLGHALNLAMSCLGAFVHPLRLTFVEYFKNSGYEGKGTAFRPLKKQTVPANK